MNNEEDAGKARQADSEDANADYKEEPDVNNTEEEPTTDSGSKATATTTADPKVDAELHPAMTQMDDEMTQLQVSQDGTAEPLDPFEEEPAAHVRNCTSVSDPQRNFSEGGVRAGDICSRGFVGDVALPWLPRSLAFNDYYLEEWPPPEREWSGQVQRRRHTTTSTAYDSLGPVLHQEHRRSIMLSTVVMLTTAVVHLSESGNC